MCLVLYLYLLLGGLIGLMLRSGDIGATTEAWPVRVFGLSLTHPQPPIYHRRPKQLWRIRFLY